MRGPSIAPPIATRCCWGARYCSAAARTSSAVGALRTPAQIARGGGHRRHLGGRDVERVHRSVRKGAEAAVRIQEDAFGRIDAERLLDGRTNLRRCFDLVGARVDDAKADLLARELDECPGPLGGVLQDELRDLQAIEIWPKRLVAAAQERRLVAAPVAAADVDAEPH